MKFDRWLKGNATLIDWNLFSAPWDAMQLKHNPFRREQIEATLAAAGVREKEAPIVLDLGCGPGILGMLLIHERPLAHYHGVDGDPLMLTAMQRLLIGKRVQALQFDLRQPTGAGH